MYAEYLVYCQRVRQFNRSPLAVSDCVSFVIDESGQLLSFGSTIPEKEGSMRRRQTYACRLGHGSKFKTVVIPRPIRMQLRIWSVATGLHHCLALAEAGHLLSWGSNEDGQCGRPLEYSSIRSCAVPRLIQPLPERYMPITQDGQCMMRSTAQDPPVRFGYIAAEESYSAAISLDGKLWECGRHPSRPDSMFPGYDTQWWHTFGAGAVSEVSDLTRFGRPRDPCSELRQNLDIEFDVSLTHVSAGPDHVLALTWHGCVLSWGDGCTGVLGHEVLWEEGRLVSYDDSEWLLPRPIEALKGVRIVAIAAGRCVSLAADEDGGLWGWGGDGWSGTAGQGPGDGPCLPTRVLTLASHKVVAVQTLLNGVTATTAEGLCFSWGSCGWPSTLGHPESELAGRAVPFEEEGNPTIDDADEPLMVLYEPMCIEALRGRRVVHVSAEWGHGLALCDDGAYYSWGEGGTCALGLPHLNACESMMGPNGWKDDGRGDNTDDAAETSEGFDKWEFFVSAPTMIPGVCGPRVCARK